MGGKMRDWKSRLVWDWFGIDLDRDFVADEAS